MNKPLTPLTKADERAIEIARRLGVVPVRIIVDGRRVEVIAEKQQGSTNPADLVDP